MNAFRFAGTRSDALIGYMKAIALLRLISDQADDEARGGWDGPAFVLRTNLNREQLADFFLDCYRPTPVMNPWNSGAGFDARSRREAAGQVLDALEQTDDPRWSASRDVLALARRIVAEAGEEPAKSEVLRTLRERYPDDALLWLDAAVVVGPETPRFPPLLGTGGNDGRLDFSINFLRQALRVVRAAAREERELLLFDALDGTSRAQVANDLAIGQYAPANAGGVNASVGFAGDTLLNPWDYVFLVEGLVVFAGAMVKRFGPSVRPAFPFTFSTTVGGYGSASSEEGSRGEVWLPRWSGFAAFRAVSNLIRTARVDVAIGPADEAGLRTRAATSALEAAQAAMSRGISVGIDGFERIVIAQRNGLAFSATRVGFVRADRANEAAAALSRNAAAWIHRLRGKGDTLGAAARQALKSYDDAVFDYAARPGPTLLQTWVAALGALDAAVAMSPPEGVHPFAFGSEGDADSVARGLEDGSPEHHIAAAFCSLGNGSRDLALRAQISPVVVERNGFVYGGRGVIPADMTRTLGAVAVRRIREAHETRNRRSIRGAVASSVSIELVRRFLDGGVDDGRIARLLFGYALLPPIRLERTQEISRTTTGRREAAVPSAAWCALKLLCDGVSDDQSPTMQPHVATLLQANDAPRALREAYRILTIQATMGQSESDVARVRDVRFASLADSNRSLAALLLPLTESGRQAVRNAVLIRKVQR